MTPPKYAGRYTARPTVYKGIQMRSRLEARYAQWLDSNKIDWQYEPRCFADENGQYLPDFVIWNVRAFGQFRTVYIEVKPTTEAFKSDIVEGRNFGSIWSSEPEACLVVEVAETPMPFVMTRSNPGAFMRWGHDNDSLTLHRDLDREWVKA